MKKSNLIKGIMLILLSVVLIGANVNGVYAADSSDDDINNILNFSDDNTSSSSGSSNTSSSTNTNTNSSSNTSKSNSTTNTNSNTNKATNTNTNASANKTNTNNTANNSSVYSNTNNSNLPKTGIEDSLPTVVLIVVFAISAVYAFKKIREYNI